MLIAEIRHKLLNLENIDPAEGDVLHQVKALLRETKEDLLTADVWGAIKYLPRVPYLQAVLRTIAASNPDAVELHRHLPTMLAEAVDFKFSFWPRYATPESLGGSVTEPDVELSSASTLLLIESKWNSGFGDRQVERELLAAVSSAEGRQCFLLLLTSGLRPPTFPVAGKRFSFNEYACNLAGLPKGVCYLLRENRHRVLWVSWRTIVRALDQARAEHDGSVTTPEVHRAGDILDDLLSLAAIRGIRCFHGIRAPEFPSASWPRVVLVPRRVKGFHRTFCQVPPRVPNFHIPKAPVSRGSYARLALRWPYGSWRWRIGVHND